MLRSDARRQELVVAGLNGSLVLEAGHLEDRLLEQAPPLVIDEAMELLHGDEEVEGASHELQDAAELRARLVEPLGEPPALEGDVLHAIADLLVRQHAICGEVDEVGLLDRERGEPPLQRLPQVARALPVVCEGPFDALVHLPDPLGPERHAGGEVLDRSLRLVQRDARASEVLLPVPVPAEEGGALVFVRRGR